MKRLRGLSCMMMQQFQDSERPPSWISIWAIISAPINIFAPNLVPERKISRPRRFVGQKSGFRKSNMADGRHLQIRKVRAYYNIQS